MTFGDVHLAGVTRALSPWHEEQSRLLGEACLSSITCKGGKGIECPCPKKTSEAWNRLIPQEEGALSWASRGDNVLLRADHTGIKKVKLPQDGEGQDLSTKSRYADNKINQGHHGMWHEKII